jgi:WD40 repeat protein
MYLIGSRSGGVDIWDYQTGQLVAGLRGACYPGSYYSKSICSNDGQLLAWYSKDGYAITVWDISSNRSCKVLYQLQTEQMANVCSCCFSRCSECLVIGCKDHVALYEARTGSLLQAVALPETY